MASKTQELFDELQAKRAAIVEKTTPLRAQRDALMRQIQGLEAQAKELADQFKAVERDGEVTLFDLDNEISGLAIALGAKRLSEAAPTEAS